MDNGSGGVCGETIIDSKLFKDDWKGYIYKHFVPNGIRLSFYYSTGIGYLKLVFNPVGI